MNEPQHQPDERAKKTRKIEIDASEEVSQGVYTNLAISHFNSEEFVLDFVYAQPQSSKGKVRSRVILHPKNVNRLIEMLIQNMEEYEEKYGSIEEGGSSGISLSIN